MVVQEKKEKGKGKTQNFFLKMKRKGKKNILFPDLVNNNNNKSHATYHMPTDGLTDQLASFGISLIKIYSIKPIKQKLVAPSLAKTSKLDIKIVRFAQFKYLRD